MSSTGVTKQQQQQSAAANANAAGQDEATIARNKIMYRLNDLRLQPIKQLPMTLFIMWMVGNSISIYTIMFVGNAVISPIQSIANAGKVFEDFEADAEKDKQVRAAVTQSKLIYIGCCLVGFCAALLKLSWMNMLPIAAMDWMDQTPPRYKETTFSTVR